MPLAGAERDRFHPRQRETVWPFSFELFVCLFRSRLETFAVERSERKPV
jgi:hypothetical protein